MIKAKVTIFGQDDHKETSVNTNLKTGDYIIILRSRDFDKTISLFQQALISYVEDIG